METTIYILLFMVGLFIGSIFFSTIFFPIFYMFPKAIYYSIKGKIKPISILVSLRTPAVILAIFVIIDIFFPNILLYLERPPINNGSNIAITLFSISRFLFKHGRLKSDADFWLSLFKYRIHDKWMENEQ